MKTDEAKWRQRQTLTVKEGERKREDRDRNKAVEQTGCKEKHATLCIWITKRSMHSDSWRKIGKNVWLFTLTTHGHQLVPD